MGKLPFICLKQQLFFCHLHAVTVCQSLYNVLELLFIRRSKENGYPKPGNERQLFLYGISGMQVFSPVILVGKAFLNQVSAVRGCIDQNILRLLFKTSFDHCLQILVLNFKILKA